MLFQEKRLETEQRNRSKVTKNRYEEKNREKEAGWIRSQKAMPRRHSPLFRGRIPGKAFLCASLGRWRKASLAVETALALPLFFLGIVSMISFMDVYRVQTEHLTALCEKAKKAGMYAYVLDGSGTEEITLPDVYSCQPVSSVIPLAKIRMINTVKVHAWTGREHVTAGSGGTRETETMVYMTENGSVYHKSLSCSYLNLSVTEVSGSAITSRRNAYGEKYYACETCSRGEKAAGVVYVTEKGNRYHNSASCSGLKRTVRLVKESEANHVHACSRCG